ncbi:hypothetical protein K492DRAFT_171294 [Lichtheimia hyalospora FSU 10163]|nr:hypothetical protein K492DRAFT_171294 [Lichtheimia hyalospora FSU 10163]
MATHYWQQSTIRHPFLGVPFSSCNQQRRMAPWELIRMNYDPGLYEDSASNSSSSAASTALDSIDSMPLDPNMSLRKHKKCSYHVLLKEIRRLRAENDGLHKMVDTIREDLRYERESRQISEQCHLKYYNESADRQLELEDDVADKQKLIDDLKLRIQELEATTPTPSPTPMPTNHPLAAIATTTTATHNNTSSSSSSRWSCFNFDDDEMLCQPLVGDSAIPDMPFVDHGNHDADTSDEEEDDDEKDNDGLTDNERFESLAGSYLHQAIISKLTSARANLELDDLMLKYDPSPAVVLRTLATSFVAWIGNVVNNDTNESIAKLWALGVTDGFLAFWKAILQKHVHDEADQTQFLNEAELLLNRQNAAASSLLVNNYHRLLIMLYKYDIVDGDAISAWWHSMTSSEDVAHRLRGVTRSFTEWLDEDDEEEDDEIIDDEEIDSDIDHSDSDTVIDSLDKHQDDSLLNHMLQEEDRNCCACQFESDKAPCIDTTIAHTTTTSSSPCKCDFTYTESPTTTTATSTTEKKPKKTVRIML